MNKIFSIVLLLLPNLIWACSYVGEGPSVNDLLTDFETHYENSEIVAKVSVTNVTENSNDFNLINTYKSVIPLKNTFTYHDQTSCDMTFKVNDEEYIVFINIISEKLYVFDANAMRSDHPQYKELQELLSK